MSAPSLRAAIVVIGVLAILSPAWDPARARAQNSVLFDPLADRWIYDAVEALDLRGLNARGFPSSKPWSTEEIETLVEGIDSLAVDGPRDPFAQGLVELLRGELRAREPEQSAATIEAEVSLHGTAGRYELDPAFRSLRVREDLGNPDLRAEARLRFGAHWPRAHLSALVDGSALSSARNRFDVRGSRDGAAVAVRSAYLLWENTRLLLVVGRLPVEWGNGLTGGLGITAAGPSLDGFLGRARWKYAHATILSAFLEDEFANRRLDRMGNTVPSSIPDDDPPIVDRYLHGHRVDIRLGRLDLGIYETALVSGVRRHADLRFAVGLLPYNVAQLERDEVDEVDINLAAGGQFRLRLPFQALLYGEYFADEIFLDTDLGEVIRGLRGQRANTQGFQQGVRWLEPFGAEGLQLEAEWIRLERFVYLHRGLNTNWRRRGVPIGSFLGPDSERLAIAVRYDRLLDGAWASAELGVVFHRRGIGRITDNVDIQAPAAATQPRVPAERRRLLVADLRLIWPGVGHGGVRVQGGRIENANNLAGEVAEPLDLELYVALTRRWVDVR
jgi:hypothetical protein